MWVKFTRKMDANHSVTAVTAVTASHPPGSRAPGATTTCAAALDRAGGIFGHVHAGTAPDSQARKQGGTTGSSHQMMQLCVSKILFVWKYVYIYKQWYCEWIWVDVHVTYTIYICVYIYLYVYI